MLILVLQSFILVSVLNCIIAIQNVSWLSSSEENINAELFH